MELVVCNRSALYFWCHVATSVDAVSQACKKTCAQDAASGARQFDCFELGEFDFGSPPLHLFSSEKRWCVPSKQVYCHRLTEQYPIGAFRKIASAMYVSSPELCFLEMASCLPFPKLIELGWFFCGTYSYRLDGGVTNNRLPLVRKDRIEVFLEKCPSRRGVALARRALKYVCENSASPMETKLAMLLCLPVRMGGYGLPLPEMNHEVNYSLCDKRLFHRQKAVLDIFWPEYGLGLEYDGREHHSDSDAISEDRQKDSAVASYGINLVRVDNNQISSPYEVYVLAKKIGRITKHYQKTPTDSQWQHHCELYSQLMRK